MRKYFFHTGSEQKGPFDIQELKEQKITEDTMVWYEGADNWKKAIVIEELKDILIAKPPPFQKEATPPSFSKEEPSAVVTSPPKPKKRTTLFKILTVIIVLLSIAGGLVMMQVINNSNGNSFLRVTVNPPNPRVVSQDGREDRSSGMLDYVMGVDASILNQGGRGSVLVTCYMYQNGNTYERSQEIYMSENEVQKIHFTFNEAQALRDQKYRVTAKAIE